MARSIAGRAELAADKLEAFLRDRPPATSADRETSEWPSQGTADAGAKHESTPAQISETSAMAPASLRPGAPLRLPHTDWLRHRLIVTGPAAEVNAFRSVAAGAGTIPWRLDLDTLQEDWFHLLVNPASRSLSLAGARVLAGQLREAVERRHAIAVLQVGRSRACPFDLNALVPVPADILLLGPDHPSALAWLWQHWGTTEPLRHVAPDLAGKPWLGQKGPDGETALRLVFWSADWTPWRALARIRADWPGLRLDVHPDYVTG